MGSCTGGGDPWHAVASALQIWRSQGVEEPVRKPPLAADYLSDLAASIPS